MNQQPSGKLISMTTHTTNHPANFPLCSRARSSWLPSCRSWLALVSPWLGIYQIDSDEGLELGKAARVAAGYAPYGEIWNESWSPVLSLSRRLRLISPNDVHAARLLVMGRPGPCFSHSLLRMRPRKAVTSPPPSP